MKFLVEKTLNEINLFSKIKNNLSKIKTNLTSINKSGYKEYIQDLIKNNKNLNIKAELYQDLAEKATNENYLNYLSNLKTPIDDEEIIINMYQLIHSGDLKGTEPWLNKAYLNGKQTFKTIQALIDNESLTGKEKWLNSNALYKEKASDTAFKIKAITFIKKKQNTPGYEDLSIDLIRDPNTKELYSARTIKKHLQALDLNKNKKENKKEIEKQKRKEAEEIAKKGDTGVNILINHLNIKKIDQQSLHNYVKSIIDDSTNMKTITDELIDSGQLDDEFEDLLKDRYISYIGREPLELLNNKLRQLVKKETNDSLGGMK